MDVKTWRVTPKRVIIAISTISLVILFASTVEISFENPKPTLDNICPVVECPILEPSPCPEAKPLECLPIPSCPQCPTCPQCQECPKCQQCQSCPKCPEPPKEAVDELDPIFEKTHQEIERKQEVLRDDPYKAPILD